MKHALIIAGLLLSGCTAQPNHAEQAALSRAKSEIGQARWIVVEPFDTGVSFCPRIRESDNPQGCTLIKTGKFIIEDAALGYSNVAYYRIRFDDGRTGYVSTGDSRFKREAPETTAARQRQAARQAAAECNRKGMPKIGMTMSELARTCLGRPYIESTTTTDNGTIQFVSWLARSYSGTLINGQLRAFTSH